MRRKSNLRNVVKYEVWERLNIAGKLSREYEEDIKIIEKITDAVMKLRRINNKLNRLNELYCDPKWFKGVDPEENWDKWDDLYQKEYNRLTEKAEKLAKENNIYIRIQGDPRGSAIKISLYDPKSVEFVGTDTDLFYI